jgi:hypothetical protein
MLAGQIFLRCVARFAFKWTREIQSVMALTTRENVLAATPIQAVAMLMWQRGERHIERVAGIVEKTLPHVESMEPSTFLIALRMYTSSTRSHGERLG